MTNSLGMSIGMTNLVAAQVGAPPVTRQAVLTLYPNRAPEVGAPSENPNAAEPGIVMSGFVERVGDPVPLVASDGSSYRAEVLLVEALDALTYAVGDGSPPARLAIAVPAHWGPAVLGALRGALRMKPNLSPSGVPPALVPDAGAALAALQASPGLPDSGIVALLDFGGSGTSITLADAANDFQPIDETLRYTEFSGAQIDQALLNQVLTNINQSDGTDTAGTTAVGALTRLREQCRQAKERLSAETAAELPADMPGYRSNVRVTRPELEDLVRGPLAGLLDAFEELLQRNRIAPSSLTAIATVGGGAAIPLVTQQLSERFRVPVVTTPQPALNTAAGAALIADRGPGADVPTGLATAPGGFPTGMATAAWAAGGAAVGASAADDAASSTFRALAWSEDESAPGSEPVPYTGADYVAGYDTEATTARPQMEFAPPGGPPPPDGDAPVPWYRRPPILFGAALAAVLLLGGGLAWTLTSESSPIKSTRTHTATVQATTNPETPGAPLTDTVTITGTDGSQTVVAPPSSSATSAPTSSDTMTSTATTTTTASTTTATTTQPTTTTTQPTTTQPPTTTQAPPTTTVRPPTTSAAPPTITRSLPTPGQLAPTLTLIPGAGAPGSTG